MMATPVQQDLPKTPEWAHQDIYICNCEDISVQSMITEL